MQYKRKYLPVAALALTFLLFGCASNNRQPPTPVTVSQMGWPMPIGLLGKPLGTVVTAVGSCKPVLMKNPITITIVNGQRLPYPATLELRGFTHLTKGETYEIEGYESGEFSGPVISRYDPSQSVPQTEFGYHPVFNVHGYAKIVENP